MGKYFAYGGIAILLVIILSGLKITFPTSEPEKKQESIKNQNPPPAMEISKDKTYTATLSTTLGDIVISLNSEKTPITANNFIALARKKFYDNTIFHRVIKDFMIQGGDPKGDGTGGPGYQFMDEPFDGEYTRGTVAMANRGPNTNGSQFFIIHKDTKLPKNYVIFGKVTKGLDVVDKIAEAPTKTSPNGETSAPVNPVKINSIVILGS
jgi:cyclophilin family peptidyl-prolyl cis-trans isomerase